MTDYITVASNWFEAHKVQTVFGWGPSKRMIVLGGKTPSASPCLGGGDNDELPVEGLITNNELVNNLCALVEQARREGCVYVEFRCFDDYSAYREAFEAAGFTYEDHYDVVFDMTEDPLMRMKPQKRQQLRKAQEEGETWRETRDERDVHEWYQLLRWLYRQKVHRPLPKEAWFRERILTDGCRLVVTEGLTPAPSPEGEGRKKEGLTPAPSPEGEGRIITGGAMLAVEDDRSKAYEWYKCGHVMATWAALDWCRQNGVAMFDAMGAGRPGVPYSVRDFKLEMGGTLVNYGRYRYILRPRLYRLGEWLIGLVSR